MSENYQSQPWNAERRSASGLDPGEIDAVTIVVLYIDESDQILVRRLPMITESLCDSTIENPRCS